MTNEELFRVIAREEGVTIKSTKAVIDRFLRLIREEVDNGGSVVLRGFGTFTSKVVKEREFFNVNTGKREVCPESRVFKFKPSNVNKKIGK